MAVSKPPALKPAYARKKGPVKRAYARTPGDDQTPAADPPDAPGDAEPSNVRALRAGVNPDERESRKALIASTIRRQLREAITARANSGIEEIWNDSEDLYNGVDAKTSPSSVVKTRDAAPRRTAADNRAKVFLNITKPKTQVGVSRFQEMCLPTDDKPWCFKPTPIPELADDQVQAMGEGPVRLPDGSTAKPTDVADAIKQLAKESAQRCEDWVEDQFVENKVYAQLRLVLQDAGRLGTGILKGPIPVSKKDRKWELAKGSATLKMIDKVSPTSVKVRPQDFYPDPACGDDIQRGGYCCERDFMTGRVLRQLARNPGYDANAVAQALIEGPQMRAMQRDAGHRRNEGESVHEASLFEVYYYYGHLQPEDLMLLGYDEEKMTEEQRALAVVPVRVTLLNERPIQAILSENDTGEFPYDVLPWEPVDGQIWGRGIPHKMAVAQKILNAAVRALLENAGVASGPQIAITKGSLTPLNGMYEIVGRKLWEFTPTATVNDINKAMAVWTVPSIEKELMNIITFALQIADVLTNLPMLMQGDQKADTSPETLGGLKMLLGNASSPLRTIAKCADDKLFLPHLRRWYDYAMQHGPNNVKGDCQVEARASTALLQREEGKEFLTQLFPVIHDPDLRINPSKYIVEAARAWGYDITSIQFTQDEWKQIQAQKAKQGPPPSEKVQVAQIGAESRVKAEEIRTQIVRDSEVADRQLRMQELEMTERIAMLENSTKRGIAIDQVKKELAIAAQSAILERENMAVKAASPDHEGVPAQGSVQ